MELSLSYLYDKFLQTLNLLKSIQSCARVYHWGKSFNGLLQNGFTLKQAIDSVRIKSIQLLLS